jgi:hypothetical protein
VQSPFLYQHLAMTDDAVVSNSMKLYIIIELVRNEQTQTTQLKLILREDLLKGLIKRKEDTATNGRII